MPERKYTEEQIKLFEKIDNVLKRNQTLRLIRLTDQELYTYESNDENGTITITESETKPFVDKILDDWEKLTNSNIDSALKLKLTEQIKLSESILDAENVDDDQLQQLNVNCCKISVMLSYLTKKNVLAQLTRKATLNIMQHENDPRVVCAFILHYIVGLDQNEVGSHFVGKTEDGVVHKKTIERWLRKAIIEDLNPDIQQAITAQFN